LLPTHDALIEWQSVVTQGERGSSSEEAVALLFHVIDSDTDGDGRLTGDDDGSVAVSNPDGSGYNIVVAHADRVLHFESGDGEPGFLFYVSDGNLHSAQIDFQARSVVNDVDLSAPVELDQSFQGDSD
jgi:hypothetical protein